MTDPNNPSEILLNMALNGCGRTDKCTNRYCLDNPKNFPKSEAEVNQIIS